MTTENIAACRKWIFACAMTMNAIWSCAAEPFALSYRQPARNWFEALPLGNGRLGAMAFGGVESDCLVLNEDTIWTGRPLGRGNEPITPAMLKKSRELLFAGEIVKGNAALPGKLPQTSSYQPFGTLRIRHVLPEGETKDYRRSLSLDDAVARAEFARGGVRFTREAFASFTDDVVVYRVAADRPGAVAFEVFVESPRPASCAVEDGALVVRGVTAGDALKYEGRAVVRVKGGTAKAAGDKIVVADADEATIYMAIATNYRNFRDLTGDPTAKCRAALGKALGSPYEKARAAHVAFYRAQADRCTFSLGPDAHPSMPTDERIAANDGKGDDLYLYALLFRYGRYLLISSSQPGTQAANLQGIWNKDMRPAWRSNYTININTQMNYWPAEVTGLGDLAEPLWRLCDEIAVTGREYAHDVYEADGWTTHHNTDLWRWVAPTSSPRYGMWPTGGTWLAMHIWYHWLYTRDRDVLARHYPTLKGAADFLVSYMTRDPNTGKLTVCPSMSPENIAKPYKRAVMPSNAIDHQLARDMLSAVAEATEILGGDKAYAEKLRRVAADVEPTHIGRHRRSERPFRTHQPSLRALSVGPGHARDAGALRGGEGVPCRARARRPMVARMARVPLGALRGGEACVRPAEEVDDGCGERRWKHAQVLLVRGPGQPLQQPLPGLEGPWSDVPDRRQPRYRRRDRGNAHAVASRRNRPLAGTAAGVGETGFVQGPLRARRLDGGLRMEGRPAGEGRTAPRSPAGWWTANGRTASR